MLPEPGSTIFGRDAEVSGLTELMKGLQEGHGGLAWIQGEPGIGKSTLVDILANTATARGATVYRGTGDELAQSFPLRLMADCLGISSRSPDPARAEIAGLLRGEASPPGTIDPILAASERMLELVDRLCAEQPVVLIAEDLQWADEPSLLVWYRLARAVDQIPLLLVGTCRPVPHRGTVARLTDVVAELAGPVMSLSPLGDDEVEQVAQRILSAPPGPALRTELARAGGNPFNLRELIDALVRDGLITVSDGVAEFRGDSGATPSSLAVAIGRRLQFEGPHTAEVLRLAALLGAEFGLGELSIVTTRSMAELSAATAEAITAGVLRPAGQQLAFRHELVRQVLVEQTPAAVRTALHDHIAHELATRGGQLDVVARHLLAMPNCDARWVPGWLTDLPESALYPVPQVSAELLARAVGAIGMDDPRWARLTGRLAQVLFWLGRDEEAGRTARQVIGYGGEPILAAQMGVLVLRSAGRMGQPAAALAVAMAPVDPRVPLAYQARLSAWAAVTQTLAGEPDAANAVRAALALARRSADPLAIGYALHAQTLGSDAAAALKHIDEALSVLGEDPESMDLRLLLLNNRLTYLAFLGRWQEARASLPEALVLAERSGTFRAAGLLATAAEVAYLRGDWDEAMVQLAGIEPEYLTNRSNLNAVGLAAMIVLRRGDRDRAEEHLRAAGATEPPDDPDAQPPANWRLLAAWALRAEVAGKLPGALALLRTWLNPTVLHGQEVRQELMPHLVRLARALGDVETARAAAAASQADSDADPMPVPVRQATARCCRAQVDEDVTGLLAAAEEYQANGWPAPQALALEEAAVLLAAAGDTARARSAFNSALRLYFRLGAAWDIRRTEARLRVYGVRRGSRTLSERATTGWAALTPSEQRVARLVARGLSNPDIALELFLSRRTVQTHVSNILVKLRVRSRIDVVRIAVGTTGLD